MTGTCHSALGILKMQNNITTKQQIIQSAVQQDFIARVQGHICQIIRFYLILVLIAAVFQCNVEEKHVSRKYSNTLTSQ